MSALGKSQSTVHLPVRRQVVPMVHRVGDNWRLLPHDTPLMPARAVRSSGQDADGLLDVLSDLAHYGLVLPLAEVSPGAMLWWPGRSAPEGELQAPEASERHGDATSATLNRIQWCCASPTTDRWRYGVSTMARWMAVSACLPVVHQELLSVAAAMDALPKGDVCLSLGTMNPAGFAWLWRRSTWEAVQRRTVLLRERRRLSLGLPAQHDPAQLDRLIQQRFVLPAAKHQLDAVNSDPRRRLHLLSHDELDQIKASAKTLELPVGRYISDDPLGDNIYVLGSQRIHPATTLARRMRCTGRRLVTLAHRTQSAALSKSDQTGPEWGTALVAALQLDYLQTHGAAPGLFGR